MRTQSGFGLAFLDLLSCALGAVILLFLIFSTFEHLGDQRSRADNGQIDRTMILAQPTNSTTDPTPLPRLLRLSLDAPGPGIEVRSLHKGQPPDFWPTTPKGQWTSRFLILASEFSHSGLQASLPTTGRATLIYIEALAGIGSGWRQLCSIEEGARQLVMNFEPDGQLRSNAGSLDCQEPDEYGADAPEISR